MIVAYVWNFYWYIQFLQSAIHPSTFIIKWKNWTPMIFIEIPIEYGSLWVSQAFSPEYHLPYLEPFFNWSRILGGNYQWGTRGSCLIWVFVITIIIFLQCEYFLNCRFALMYFSITGNVFISCYFPSFSSTLNDLFNYSNN